MEHKVQVIRELNEEVVLTGAKFWLACHEAQLEPKDLKELLPRLIPMLLFDMSYADEDESILVAKDPHSTEGPRVESSSSNSMGESIQQTNISLYALSDFPARDWKYLTQLILQEMCNRTSRQQRHSQHMTLQENHYQPENNREGNRWDIRTCSGEAIDILSHVFGYDVLPILMPLFEANLSNSCDENWRERDTALYALGVIFNGCSNVLYPQLSKIVAMLLRLLDDKFLFIRRKACWLFSSCSKYLVQNCCTLKGREQFEKVLLGLLRNLLHTDQQVQQAACTVLSNLEEEAGKELVPYIGVILEHLMCAFGNVQIVNFKLIYTAIGRLADSVGKELHKPAYLELMIPQLFSEARKLLYSDVYSWLKCHISLSKALGIGFAPFAQPVFKICMDIIQQLAKVDPASDGASYDKDIIVWFLVFLSQIADRLGSGIVSLVTQSGLMDFLVKCCTDEDIDVKRNGFYLVDNLVRVSNVGFTQHVFQRCIEIIELQQLAKVDPASAGAPYNMKFICCSLQLLSALTKELSTGIESLVSQSYLRYILLKCCIDVASDVRKDAFALLADLARVIPVYLQPNLFEFLDIASHQLSIDNITYNFAVANNACWFIGELLVKCPQEHSTSFFMTVLQSLALILLNGQELINQCTTRIVEESEMRLVVNSATTLGILAWIRPDLVELRMHYFFEPWCMTLSMVCDSIKKEKAFRGLCAVLKMYPSRRVKSLVHICLAFASWEEITNEEVKNEYSLVLNIYKNMLGNSWEQFISSFDPLVKVRLARFQVYY